MQSLLYKHCSFHQLKHAFLTGQSKLQNRFVSGESFLHFEYLKKDFLVDKYNFPVPVSAYDPNELDRISKLDSELRKALELSNPMMIAAS